MPTTPQKEAGSLIEPPVSDPRAATAMSDATAAAAAYPARAAARRTKTVCPSGGAKTAA